MPFQLVFQPQTKDLQKKKILFPSGLYRPAASHNSVTVRLQTKQTGGRTSSIARAQVLEGPTNRK